MFDGVVWKYTTVYIVDDVGSSFDSKLHTVIDLLILCYAVISTTVVTWRMSLYIMQLCCALSVVACQVEQRGADVLFLFTCYLLWSFARKCKWNFGQVYGDLQIKLNFADVRNTTGCSPFRTLFEIPPVRLVSSLDVEEFVFRISGHRKTEVYERLVICHLNRS